LQRVIYVFVVEFYFGNRALGNTKPAISILSGGLADLTCSF